MRHRDRVQWLESPVYRAAAEMQAQAYRNDANLDTISVVSTPSRSPSIRARSVKRLPPAIPKPGYEIFIGLLAVLSIINLVIIYVPGFSDSTQQIARFMDAPLTVVFMFDFLRHLALAHPRRTYLVDERGWIDFLGSLPTIFPILRLFRLVRVLRLLRTYRPRDVFATVRRDRAATALQLVLFLVLVTVEFGGMLVLAFEQGAPDANIRTGGDVIWWAFVSITTVGYGDKYPVTTGGRMTAVVMLWMGVALIGVLSAYLANSFLRPVGEDSAPVAPADASPETLGTTADLMAMADDLEVRLAALRAAIARLPTPDGSTPDSKGPPA